MAERKIPALQLVGYWFSLKTARRNGAAIEISSWTLIGLALSPSERNEKNKQTNAALATRAKMLGITKEGASQSPSTLECDSTEVRAEATEWVPIQVDSALPRLLTDGQ